MTTTGLEPARNRHGLNLTFFAAGPGKNPRSKSVPQIVPQKQCYRQRWSFWNNIACRGKGEHGCLGLLTAAICAARFVSLKS